MMQLPTTVNTAVCDAITLMRADLDGQRLAISRELCSIPPPVPACDVDFNRLLEQRAGIIDEMQQLKRMLASEADEGRLLDFCRASLALSPNARVRVEALLQRMRR
jgi:hypothetical protein